MLFLAGLMIHVFQQHLKNLFDFFSIALALIYSIQVFGIQIFLNSPSTLQVLFTYPHFSCLYHQSCMLHIFSLLNGSLNIFTSGEFDFSYFPKNGFNFQKVLFCKLIFVSCIISSTSYYHHQQYYLVNQCLHHQINPNWNHLAHLKDLKFLEFLGILQALDSEMQ